MMALQYEIFIVNLDPTIGSEIRKTRPCVIISPDEMNQYLDTVIIAPITSQSKDYPTRVKFILDKKPNWIVLDQIRTIDKTRLTKRIANLNKKEIIEVKLVIRETFVD